nr:MAG TPA: hypothetical protein [Bacteriophage sp.]
MSFPWQTSLVISLLIDYKYPYSNGFFQILLNL